VAADHHAVADLQAPDAAGGPDVDVVDALRVEVAGAADVVVPVGVPAVDDGVALLEPTPVAPKPSTVLTASSLKSKATT
jgi:hypothetical protein